MQYGTYIVTNESTSAGAVEMMRRQMLDHVAKIMIGNPGSKLLRAEIHIVPTSIHKTENWSEKLQGTVGWKVKLQEPGEPEQEQFIDIRQPETIGMDFSRAWYQMRHLGKKIKLPSWEGYWAWEDNTIKMHCKDGSVLDIRQTEDVAFTFDNIADHGWMVAE